MTHATKQNTRFERNNDALCISALAHPPNVCPSDSHFVLFSCHLKVYGQNIRIPKTFQVINLELDLVILLGQRIQLEASNVSSL